MPRPMPADFLDKDTYGIASHASRDRLTAIPAGTKAELEDVLIGRTSIPTRVAMAGLLVADYGDDIVKLVIGAIVDASGIGATKAALSKPYNKDKWSEEFISWSKGQLQAQATKTDDSSVSVPSPKGLPKWVTELDIDNEVLLSTTAVSAMEVAAYAGVLAWAISKRPDENNLTAFNQKRRAAISEFIPVGDLQIFKDDSPYLALDVLGKVHRAFNSATKDRALVMTAVVTADNEMLSGTVKMFYVIFRLSAGAGMNPLILILKFGRKYPGMYPVLSDLETEYHAASHALERLYDVPEVTRDYLKAIYGSSYVPVARNDINALLGVAVFALKQTEPNLENYKGGVLSVEHRRKVIEYLNLTQQGEEPVPENA